MKLDGVCKKSSTTCGERGHLILLQEGKDTAYLKATYLWALLQHSWCFKLLPSGIMMIKTDLPISKVVSCLN